MHAYRNSPGTFYCSLKKIYILYTFLIEKIEFFENDLLLFSPAVVVDRSVEGSEV